MQGCCVGGYDAVLLVVLFSHDVWKLQPGCVCFMLVPVEASTRLCLISPWSEWKWKLGLGSFYMWCIICADWVGYSGSCSWFCCTAIAFIGGARHLSLSLPVTLTLCLQQRSQTTSTLIIELDWSLRPVQHAALLLYSGNSCTPSNTFQHQYDSSHSEGWVRLWQIIVSRVACAPTDS